MFRCIIAVLTAIVLSACSGQAANHVQADTEHETINIRQERAEPMSEVKLAFDSKDSLNPYTAKTIQNFTICSLLFDSLTSLDMGFKPQNNLAQTSELNGNVCTVRLIEDAKFADGSPLTIADVIYSFGLAARSPYYRSALSGVVGIRSEDESIIFELSQPDINFRASLNFPILKKDSGDAQYPVSSGRFVYKDGEMVPNPMYHKQPGRIEFIKLVQLSGTENLNFAIKAGDIDYLFSDLRSNWNSSFVSNNRSVQLNNFVYAGLNSNNAILSTREFREIIYYIIDRDEIVKRAYQAYALPAFLPINPSFNSISASPMGNIMSASDINSKLDTIGFGGRDEQGYRTGKDGKRISLKLCINSDNMHKKELGRYLTQQMAAYGIELVTESLLFGEYTSALSAGRYDIFIGEVKIPDNMDITQLLTAGSGLSFAMVPAEELIESWNAYKAGTADIKAFGDLFINKIPFIPICYRKGIVSFSQSFSANVVATSQDIFYNILEW